MLKWLATAMLSGILAVGAVGCDKPADTKKKDTKKVEKADKADKGDKEAPKEDPKEAPKEAPKEDK